MGNRIVFWIWILPVLLPTIVTRISCVKLFVPLGDQGLRFRVYQGPYPQKGKSAPLQKGVLVFPRIMRDPVHWVEEGLGIGASVLQFARDFYFSGSSEIEGICWVNERMTIRKRFWFDLIERVKPSVSRRSHMLSWVWPRVNNWLYKNGIGRRLLLQVYALKRRYRRLTLEKTMFLRVPSRGVIGAEYTVDVSHNVLRVELDFSQVIQTGLQKIYVSNEFGGYVFSVYVDSAGVKLEDARIGAWDRIGAEVAGFVARKEGIGYEIRIPPAVTAYRGRECYEENIAWSGIIFEVPRGMKTLTYEVEFGRYLEQER